MKLVFSTWLRTAAVLLAAAALVGALVVVLGLVPIKASSGHWAITHHLLEFVKRRSVATQAWGTTLPSIDEPRLVLHGAGIYESNCRACHGSPEHALPLVPAASLPPPPLLRNIVQTYEPEELFEIVKHGIKFTGMPAWPTEQRDDEIVAMVAFLRELPKLDATAYRALVYGPVNGETALAVALPDLPSAAHAVTTTCARCHGRDGAGRGRGVFPSIAGQKREYLLQALNAYAENRRPSGSMAPIAAALNENERAALADYYASLPAPAVTRSDNAGLEEAHLGEEKRDEAQLDRGAAIAAHGIPSHGVPSCKDCHGPGSHARNPVYPNLAGQHRDYLLAQLELFAAGKRGGSSYAHLMLHVAPRLKRDQMQDVVAYYASLDANGTRLHE